MNWDMKKAEKKTFTVKENLAWPKPEEAECQPIDSGLKVADGMLCGVRLFFLSGCGKNLYYIDPTSRCWTAFNGEVEICIEPDLIECEYGAKPERYCLAADGINGNNVEGSYYDLTTPSGNVSLPINFTVSDVVNALGSNVYIEDGLICSLQPFSIVVEGEEAAGTPPDIVLTKFLLAKPALKRPAEPGQIIKAIATKNLEDPSSAVVDAIECLPQPTGWVVTEVGPLCGLPVFIKKGQCVVFNPQTKEYDEIMGNKIGTPAPADKNVNCYWELVQASVCATEADVTLAPADILALVAGEVFNDTAATAVDITAANQDLVWADVSGFPCDSVVKHGETEFTVTTAEACVESASGDKFNLAQGGNAVLGDSQAGAEAPITVDESVVVPAGSAVRFCFKVKLTVDPNAAKEG